MTPVAAMQLSQKNQKLAIAAAAGVAAMLVIRRKLQTKIRAAFDIGSGEHKLVVAAVNGTSVKVLHSEVSTVLLAQDLTRPGGDGALSAGALRASKEALNDLAERAAAKGAQAKAGVATAVFRRARNGEQHLKKCSDALALNLRIVPQSTEGELGFLTACAAAGREVACAWDSGGGSFQLSARVGGGGVRVYAGPLGNADAFARLRDMGGATSQNVKAAVAALTDELPPAPAWLAAALQEGPAVAFGHRSSCFRVACDAIGASGFAPEDVKRATAKLVSLGDDGARADWLQYVAQGHAHVVAPLSDRAALDEPYPEPHLALAKLVLVAAVMAKLNVERVEYHETNGSCLGVLLHEPFWE